jgi:hypothetical protein
VTSFLVGARRGDHVAVRVASRGDGALDASFDAVAAGVGASGTAPLRAIALAAFRDALRALDEGSDASADLATEGGALRIRVSRATAGAFVAQCFASEPQTETVVKVVAPIDGVQLAELVWALDGVVRDVEG